MSRVLVNVWFIIQGIIQNTTSSDLLRIQRIIKNIQGIIQRLVHYSGYYSKYDLQRLVQDSEYYLKKYPGYYSASGSGFSVLFIIRPAASGSLFRLLFKIRPAASGSGFSVLLKNIQGIIQRLFHYSGYFSKYDLQRLIQDSAFY